MRLIRIHFDGGCKPNPGNGYGSYQAIDEVTGFHYCAANQVQLPGATTSNQAEYWSLLRCLESLDRCITDKPVTELIIYSDSLLLVNQLNMNWKAKNREILQLIGRILLHLQQYGKTSIIWNSRDKNVELFGH